MARTKRKKTELNELIFLFVRDATQLN